jgi:DNA-binding transcriptional MerR regulator
MRSPAEILEGYRTWTGTADRLAHELRKTIRDLRLKVSSPTVRTVRFWRTKRLLTQPRAQDFNYRQLLEALATVLLLDKGWTLAAIGDLLPSLENGIVESNLSSEAIGADVSWVGAAASMTTSRAANKREQEDRAEDAVVLLAQGVLRQYDRVLNNEIVRQDDTLSPEIQAAMSRIGRLYIEEGNEDRAACVHDVLDRCRYPLDASEWGLAAFKSPSFRFAQATLIDTDFRVPTPDCSEIADTAGVYGEDNLLEYRFHNRLREAAERCGRLRDLAYTRIREFLGRRSLISEREFAGWLVENKMTPLQQSVLDEFFQPVQELWLINGRAHRCGNCGTLMRPHPDTDHFPDGRCPIRQCNGKFSPRIGERLDPLLGLHVAKPQILMYWTGPAIDEIAIYDEAIRRGLQAELYPENDLCDVAIDGRAIGIDAKSYSSPISLALRLNRSIGGLINYRRRIIAVGDEHLALRADYIATVRSCLDKHGDPGTLEIRSVSWVIQMLRNLKHAQQA